jgi:hypothetical protein
MATPPPKWYERPVQTSTMTFKEKDLYPCVKCGVLTSHPVVVVIHSGVHKFYCLQCATVK